MTCVSILNRGTMDQTCKFFPHKRTSKVISKVSFESYKLIQILVNTPNLTVYPLYEDSTQPVIMKDRGPTKLHLF